MGLLNVHTAAMLTECFGASKAVASPLPEPHHLAAIADDQVEIIRVNMTSGVGKGVFLAFGIVVAHFAKEFIAVALLPVVADVNAVGMPILVTDPLLPASSWADLPGAASVHVQTPNAIIDQMPRPFMTKGEQMR
jgi:hypothetical protein